VQQHQGPYPAVASRGADSAGLIFIYGCLWGGKLIIVPVMYQVLVMVIVGLLVGLIADLF
jgi:hypothetical protein